MSYWSQKRSGNSMGDPADHGRFPAAGRGSTAGKDTGNGKKTASFKSFGDTLNGMPNQDDDFPKAGKDIEPSFKLLRKSTIGRGSI